MKKLAFFLFITTAASADNLIAAHINTELGLAYLAEGYAVPAKAALLTALHDAPTLEVTWYSMAYYLEKTGDSVQAELYYQKAIKVNGYSGEAKNNYGAFLCRHQ